MNGSRAAASYKVGRMAYEGPGTDMQTVAQPVKANFEAFAAETVRVCAHPMVAAWRTVPARISR